MLKFFFKKILQESEEIRFSASSLAFSTLLSLVPFLIVVLTVFQSIGLFNSFYPQVEGLIFSSVKDATGYLVSKYLKTTIGNFQFKAIGITGAIVLIISCLALIKNIDLAFHRIMHLKMKSSYLRRAGFYTIVLFLTPFVLMLLTTVMALELGFYFTKSGGKSFLLFSGGTVLLWMMYQFIPEAKMRFLATFISALLTSLALSVIQKSFLWLSLLIFTHNKIYGSLASFPIFLIWLMTVWYVILSGLSFCAFLQQKILKSP